MKLQEHRKERVLGKPMTHEEIHNYELSLQLSKELQI